MHPFRAGVLVLALATAAIVPACDDSPIRVGVAPTLENIWPSEDGRWWDYTMTSRVWSDGSLVDSAYIYPDSVSVPAAPGLSEILQWLSPDDVPAVLDVGRWSYLLEFDGQRTTSTGVTGQNLVAATIADGIDPEPPAAPSPVVLRGGVWEKTDAWIGSYGDIDTLLSWIYLKPDLSPGATFTFESSGRVLTAWVVDWDVADTPVGSFQNAVEVVYRLDLGITCGTTVFTTPTYGCYRLVLVGRVVYAPTIGPVHLYERSAAAGDPHGWGWGDITLELMGVSAGDP
jgi:hypothetical protein